KTIRDKIFTTDWSSLKQSIKNFNSLEDTISIKKETLDTISLGDILNKDNLLQEEQNQEEEDENRRFESTISFHNNLIQIKAVKTKLAEQESNLDDKNLPKNL